MEIRHHRLFLAFLVAFFAVAETGLGQNLAEKLRLPFRRGRSANESNRDLTVKDGPWLIMCSSFTGENAEQQARQLADELRQNRLKTYLFRHTFDYSGTVTGLGWTAVQDQVKPLQMKAANHAVVNEVAVLVGDFSSADDSKAQKALEKIKSLSVGTINSAPQTTNRQSTVVVSEGGPLRRAFLLPNPLLPDEYFRRDRVDDFVFKLNKNVEHSLLNCPGLYSVKIATFRGEATIDPARIKNSETELLSLKRSGKSLQTSRLVQAAEKAHMITQILRERNVEAYEFHDRDESYVCIGSFDWVTRKSNETILNNPEIVRIVNRCRPEVKNLAGAPNAIIPKSIRGIPLDPEPAAILVPKADARTARRIGLFR